MWDSCTVGSSDKNPSARLYHQNPRLAQRGPLGSGTPFPTPAEIGSDSSLLPGPVLLPKLALQGNEGVNFPTPLS